MSLLGSYFYSSPISQFGDGIWTGRYTITIDLPRNVYYPLRGIIMKTKFAATALIIASGLIAATPSFAALTSEQVRAEHAAAVRSGDIMASGELSGKLNELFPGRYPAKQVPVNVTREQVQAELAAATRSGDIMANGEISAKLNELYPERYPAQQVKSNLTREQVNSALAEALRSGYLIASGEFPIN